jgi:hypothetical protein
MLSPYHHDLSNKRFGATSAFLDRVGFLFKAGRLNGMRVADSDVRARLRLLRFRIFASLVCVSPASAGERPL